MQESLFNIKPADNTDLVDVVRGYIASLEGVLPLFSGKDAKLVSRFEDQINGLIQGMKETMEAGVDLIDLPEADSIEKFVEKMTKKAGRMRSQADADAMDIEIAKKVKAKDERLKLEGNLARPFTVLCDIPGIDVTRSLSVVHRAGINLSPVVAAAEKKRQRLNSMGIYDSQQMYRLAKSEDAFGFFTGTVGSFIKDAYSLLKDDSRADAEWRTSRIIQNGMALGVNYKVLHPDNLTVARMKAGV